MADVSYRFGPFLVDRGGFRVLRDGLPLVLTPKLLDLLLHFLDQPGQLVTKEALLDALWPDANVTENALAQAMSELRQALGDEPAAPQFIKTIARRADYASVVTAVPDAGRGGRLVAFYTDPDTTPHVLWEGLCRTELPRLWLAKREDIHFLENIPTLGTGRVDWRRVRELVVERSVVSV